MNHSAMSHISVMFTEHYKLIGIEFTSCSASTVYQLKTDSGLLLAQLYLFYAVFYVDGLWSNGDP